MVHAAHLENFCLIRLTPFLLSSLLEIIFLDFTFKHMIYFESISIRSRWFINVFKSSISLLVFCVIFLSFIEIGILKYVTIIVCFSCTSTCCIYFETLLLGACWRLLCLIDELTSLSLWNELLYPGNILCSEI